MTKTRHCLAALLAACLAIACQSNGACERKTQDGDTVQIKYARNLTIVEHEGHTDVEIRNPWDTASIMHRYCLSEDGGRTCCKDGNTTVVHVPLRKAVVFSGVHCALIGELGKEDAIAGVCDPQFIHLPSVTKGIENGTIATLGNGMNPNIEQMIDLQPDALMPSPYENSGGYGRMERLGIPIIECADYMETGPLARAEWIRFYGRLLDAAETADSIFRQVERQYALTKEAAEKSGGARPRIICELPTSGVWYMPGSESTMGTMYKDAGADYLFSDRAGAGSVSLGMEQVMDRAVNADIWLIKKHGSTTRGQIVKDMPLLKNIPATIWLCDTEHSMFYEETPFHPERLLENLVQIFHPELGLKAKKTYFCPLE